MSATFATHVRPRLLAPAPAAVIAMAEQVRQHHAGVAAVLAYGSSLRDAKPAETLIDLYVLTDTGAGVSPSLLSQMGCALLPPNVYYAERASGDGTCRAKYAVLPLSALAARVGRNTANPYFWARFAQPLRLVWSRSDADTDAVLAILAEAAETAVANARGLSRDVPPAEQWASLFRETYRTELRPESADRARLIVEAESRYYTAVSEIFADTSPVHGLWAMRRLTGKALSVLRLVKAAFTFQGGADYIAWKIKRHSGVEIAVTDFHRRHPLLAGLLLLPQLLRKGAVR